MKNFDFNESSIFFKGYENKRMLLFFLIISSNKELAFCLTVKKVLE